MVYTLVRYSEVIMRAKEFINEEHTGAMRKSAEKAHQGVWKMRDVGGYDRTYHLSRIMMAAAMSDGSSDAPVDIDSASWIEKYNTAYPYTEQEHNMMKSAMNTIPTDGQHVSTNHKSQELDSIQKVSPVSNWNAKK